MTAPELKKKRAMIITLVALGLMGAANLLIVLHIMPAFQQIYADALPGRPLPGLTHFILDYRLLLGLIAMAWVTAGVVLARQRNRFALWVVQGGMLWCFLQIGVIIYALFIPMVGPGGGMSPAP